MLFDGLIVWYLFLGGLGGGLLLVALFVHVRARRNPARWLQLDTCVWRAGLIGSGGALAAGCLCLLKDLARADKALLLLFKPTFSAISVGTFALGGLLACLAALVVLDVRRASVRAMPAGAWHGGATTHGMLAGRHRLGQGRFRARLLGNGRGTTPSPLEALLEMAAAVLSLVVVIYTGVLLNGIAAVPFWRSPLVPVLFLLSSLSSGTAGIVLVAAFRCPHPRDLSATTPAAAVALGALLKADAVIIVLEAAAFVAFALLSGGNAAAAASLQALVTGHCAQFFWLGFVACGLATPLFMELALSSRLSRNPAFSLALGCLILVGAFFLRHCLIFGGIHLSAVMFA